MKLTKLLLLPYPFGFGATAAWAQGLRRPRRMGGRDQLVVGGQPVTERAPATLEGVPNS